MCGICGVVQVDGTPRAVVTDARLAVMTDAMTHRGPDDRGTYVADGIALGVRRLSIIDVEGGHQPFGNERGDVWAIQNGELYNYSGLRTELERAGHSFRSRCDTEVLPHLYEQHGASFPTRLRGMFAVAVWDTRSRRLVLARDRLGKKPLYYAHRGDVLVFASELKALLAGGLVSHELDYEAIDAYLTLGFFPGPRTPLAGVAKLMPGHLLVVDERGVRVETFWRYPKPDLGNRQTESEYRERLLAELDESVRLRLMSDVPLGAMLSGGIDSSLVVGLMAQHTAEPVKTFSVAFAEDRKNELDDARLVSRHFGTDHHELELSLEEDAIDLEDLVWNLDEPLADLSSLGFLALCELAARHVTVALSGQGADELFGGYPKHLAASIAARWRRLPRGVRDAAGLVAPRAPTRLRRGALTLAAADPVDRLLAMSGRMDTQLRRTLTRGPLSSLDGGYARQAIIDRLDGVPDDPLPVTLHLDAQLALVDDMLHYFDRASMAHSLEVRVPFLDHHLVEFAATIPADLKVRGRTTKYLLREIAKTMLPPRVLEKPKVGFFTGAVAAWFDAQSTRSIAAYLLQPSPRYADMLEPSRVEALVRKHTPRSSRAESQLLLAILMLEVWLATFLPRATAMSRVAPTEPATAPAVTGRATS